MPEALNKASWKLYYVFGAINLGISVVTYLFYPETAQKSLEELDLLFTPNRRILACLDREACRKGTMLGSGLEGGVEVARELQPALVMGVVVDEKAMVREEERV
ncbi:hypothetical protein BO70DRAFT_393135 [Aspergillus heteromorphus CBS 117.55]|uniref:Major facilitator superfamily (MFS) profile domain-containing protein n=1 Tax=Aspergillus heteromorphus CBS 117.55 TaxID=1448321 RepID=A0A317WU45_9EURO|nr:uncharacterized protein BO70DRAFT_393135 [Aspergillus heteromorphus CBS 117.55]PWY89943.1 hypothetical protein BO70DRAFT_393135 [Aspergillus heteromorphus CBS 117.55]